MGNSVSRMECECDGAVVSDLNEPGDKVVALSETIVDGVSVVDVETQ